MGQEPSWGKDIRKSVRRMEISPWDDEQKAASLMLGENLINLVKAITER
jgi:hypothetical protein